MGYAIPISSVEDLINNMMNQKTKVQVDEDQRGYLGIQGVDVPMSMYRDLVCQKAQW